MVLLTACGLAAIWLLPVTVQPLVASSLPDDSVRVVGREELLEAMRQCAGYDPTATTNGARFQAEVLLRLARQTSERDPEGSPLFVGHEDWFRAFLCATGRTESTAPLYSRLAYRYGQDMEIDCRSGRVVRKVEEGPVPELAANVVIWWPENPGKPDRYSYQDTLSTPHLNVTNRRVITYRLLDFGDMIAYDKVEGLTGRPTSGILGFLFRIIGEGRVVQSRMAISRDDLQVSRARAKKGFIGVTTTVTVYPDGRTEKDVPADRPDLASLEERLKQPLKIEYFAMASHPK